ncbi:MAG TPA: hypothetical protein VGI12_07600 [Vicinamibacterales bacterium]|jgi:hypothetical protein
MTATVVLASLLSLLSRPPQESAVQPRFAIRFPVAHSAVERSRADVICGLVLIRKTPADDPKMLVPRRETGAAVRRVEPFACTAAQR